MCKESGVQPELVMGLSGLTERFHVATDDEGWTAHVGPANASEPQAKPKPRVRKGLPNLHGF